MLGDKETAKKLLKAEKIKSIIEENELLSLRDSKKTKKET